MQSLPNALLYLFLCVTVGTALETEIRSYDGRGNNPTNPELGASNTARVRLFPPESGYLDGVGIPMDEENSELPSARRIMEDIFRVAEPKKDKTTNHLSLAFGQFLTQDMMGGSSGNSSEPFDIPCDGQLEDILFCPVTGESYNITEIPFSRRKHVQQFAQGPRATRHGQTHFLDLSTLYGTTPERVAAMRGGLAGGLLKLDDDFLCPRENLSGAMRSTPGVYVFYVIFMRYHNWVATLYAADDPSLSGDELFELARRKTIAVYQSIAEEKYVTSLLGQVLEPYAGYNENVNPSVDEFFASVGFRYAHSSQSGVVRHLDESFEPTAVDPFYIRDVFAKPPPNDFPAITARNGGIEPLLRGFVVVPGKGMDGSFVDDLNIWSKATTVLDVQRGRDVGIPSYNDVRVSFGLETIKSMDELAGDDENVASALKHLYGGNVDKVDAFVGAFLEPLVMMGDQMGPLLTHSIRDQFMRLRDGDRFWFKNVFTPEEYESFPTLTDVIKTVCTGMDNFPADAFGNYRPEGDDDVCQAQTTQLSLLGGNMQLSWHIVDDSNTDSQFRRHIDVTVTANHEMEGYGFLGVGWRSKTMRGAEIWFCTVNNDPYDSLGPFPDKCPNSEDVSTPVFDCCVAEGTSQRSIRCDAIGEDASEEDASDEDSGGDGYGRQLQADPKYYRVEVVDWCLTSSTSSVTVRAPVCDDDDVVQGGKVPCFRLSSTADDKIDFIAAYNPFAKNRPHGISRKTAAQTDLVAGVLTESEVGNTDAGLVATHGIFLLTSWLILAPAGVFIVRYMKTRTWRLVAHIGIMGIVGSLMVPLLIGIEASVGASTARSEHQVVGLSLMGVYFVMAAAGRVRYSKLSGNRIGKNTDLITHLFHRYVGASIIVLSWWNCYTGLVRIAPEDEHVQVVVLSSFAMGYDIPIFGTIRDYIFFPWIGFVLLVFFIAEIRKWRNAGSAHSVKVKAVIDGAERIWDDDDDLFGEMTIEDFLDSSRHTALCVVDGRVLDISDFMETHPGGRHLLRYAQGSDITEIVLGHRGVEGHKHAHSRGALKLMNSLVVATLVESSSVEFSDLQFAPESNAMKLEPPSSNETTRAFLPGRVVSATYMTPSLFLTPSTRPVICLRLAVSRRSSKGQVAGLKRRCLEPSAVFTFRGVDSRGRHFERHYTPVYLGQGEEKPSSLTYLPEIREKSTCETTDEEYHDFLISLVPSGQMSEFFLGLKPGKAVLCHGPQTDQLTLEKIDSDWATMVMIAAGTGISPMLQTVEMRLRMAEESSGDSLKDSRHSHRCPRMFLIWVLKSPDHDYSDRVGLASYARRSLGRFRYTIVYSSYEPSIETSPRRMIGPSRKSVETAGGQPTQAGKDSKGQSTDAIRGSQWTGHSLLDMSLVHRAKQTLKTTFAKYSMNIQDMIETTNHERGSKESEKKAQLIDTEPEFTPEFWKRNGRSFCSRVNRQVLRDILISIETYSKMGDDDFMGYDGVMPTVREDSSPNPAQGGKAHVYIPNGDGFEPPIIDDDDNDVEPSERSLSTTNKGTVDVEQGDSLSSFPRMLLLVSGSPRFEVAMNGDLRSLGVPQEQIASFRPATTDIRRLLSRSGSSARRMSQRSATQRSQEIGTQLFR